MDFLARLIAFLDGIIPGKGWRTMVVTAIVGAALNYMAAKGMVIDDAFTAAFTTVVMGIFAFILRLITTGPVATKK